MQAERVKQRVELAADYLRRFYVNVFRCDLMVHQYPKPVLWGDLHGVPDRGVGYYHVDKLGVLANNDVIALAIKRGWESHLYD